MDDLRQPDGGHEFGSKPIPKFLTGVEVDPEDYLSLPRTPSELADPEMHRNLMALNEFVQRAEGMHFPRDQFSSLLRLSGRLNDLKECCKGTEPEVAKTAAILICKVMALVMGDRYLNNPTSLTYALQSAQLIVMEEGIRPLEEIAQRKHERLRPLTYEEERLVLMHESQEAIRIIEAGGKLPLSLFGSMPRMKFSDPDPNLNLNPNSLRLISRFTMGKLAALGLAGIGIFGGIRALTSSPKGGEVGVSSTSIDESQVKVGDILDFGSFEDAVRQGFLVIKDGQMVPKEGYDWAYPDDLKSFSVKRVKYGMTQF